ncbi:uncharacterized protein SCHCODRAFT_02585158 [Schizophyllum commune H4-8]|nr:uncharacterized protein SCHCODRAFT_02585158 [Schizophyllum commune H4-8]KAI5889154.1 hypothetical protein SCHCODRAFT_02585158 [Schizophyllum commune H4-8]
MLDALLGIRSRMSWYWEEGLLMERYTLLRDLLEPVETLVLRNMFSYSADTLYGILLLPRRLRAFYFVGGQHEYYLQLVVFYNRIAPFAGDREEWEQDRELLQEIWRSRTALRNCATPSHLRILVPMAWTDFKEVLEVPATLIGYDGKDEERRRDWNVLQWIFAFD